MNRRLVCVFFPGVLCPTETSCEQGCAERVLKDRRRTVPRRRAMVPRFWPDHVAADDLRLLRRIKLEN